MEMHTRREVYEATKDFEDRMVDWIVDVECDELGCETPAMFVVQQDLAKPFAVAHRCWEHGKDEPHKVLCTCAPMRALSLI